MSSQPSRRRRGVSFGARSARSGARNGLAICRDSIVGGIDLALGERGRHDVRGLRGDVGDDQLVGGQLGTRLEQPVAAHAPRDGARGLVDLEQLDERRVARGGLGEDGRDAVEALEQLRARGVGERRVGLHAGALFAHQERDHLELDPVGGAELAALGLRLHLAHLAGEDRDDRRLVVAARRSRASCDAAPQSPGRALRAAVAVVGMLLLSVCAGCSGGDRSGPARSACSRGRHMPSRTRDGMSAPPAAGTRFCELRRCRRRDPRPPV